MGVKLKNRVHSHFLLAAYFLLCFLIDSTAKHSDNAVRKNEVYGRQYITEENEIFKRFLHGNENETYKTY